jgi:SAM-dependent methyltransferase
MEGQLVTDPMYEYRGLLAKTWDLFRGDTSGWEDRTFFLEMIRESGQPVLDVGCGTGRLLLDYLSQGVDVDGVDISPEMLSLCRQKAVSMQLKPVVFESDMITMKLPRQYQTIIVPSSSFQLVLDPDDAQRAIQNLYTHLLPGGSLVMPFMLEWRRGDRLETPWHLSGEKIRPDDGTTIKRWSRSRYDPDSQLMHTEDRFEVVKDGISIAEELHKRSPAVRQYTQPQALDLYDQAGFEDICMFKGFTRLPASAEDEIFSVTGKKA